MSAKAANSHQTERTHEENQERAYIAASRRSDRSLEARVESARRASEIHKKRTGRALKVTEQDVLNEEMYEEEEDDLPFPYRRLINSQLQTGSPEFNRRLSTYLTNHLAMRTALEQSIANSYQLQNGSNMPYNYNPQLMFPSPMLAHQGTHQGPAQPQVMPQQSPQQQQPHSPSATYRHAPYPQPNPYPGQHHRSASIAVPQEANGSHKGSPSLTPDHRRMSLPATPASMSHTTSTTTASGPSTPVIESSESGRLTPKQRPSFSQGTFSQLNLQNAHHQQIPNHQFYPSYNMNTNMGSMDFGSCPNPYPLTTQPSAETQMFLGAPFHQSHYESGLESTLLEDHKFSQLQNFDLSGNFSLPQEHQSPVKAEYQYTGPNFSSAANDVHPVAEGAQNHFFNEAFGKSHEATPSGTPGLNADAWDSFIDFTMPSSSQ